MGHMHCNMNRPLLHQGEAGRLLRKGTNAGKVLLLGPVAASTRCCGLAGITDASHATWDGNVAEAWPTMSCKATRISL